MELNCPSCNSDTTQLLSTVYESGISNIRTKSSGAGVGIGRGGLSVGVGTGSTSGTAQTLVSQRAAPPEKKRYTKPLLMIFVAYFVVSMVASGLGSHVLGFMATLVWICATAAWIYHAFRYNAKNWKLLTEQWQNSFMCHRCSHVFLPTRN